MRISYIRLDLLKFIDLWYFNLVFLKSSLFADILANPLNEGPNCGRICGYAAGRAYATHYKLSFGHLDHLLHVLSVGGKGSCDREFVETVSKGIPSQ